MFHDIELMRELMFLLEARQISPRSTVILSIYIEAEELGRAPEAVEGGLDNLLDLGYIDGAGRDEPGFWLFRKLTRKGVEFVRATRHQGDWERMKSYFAAQQTSP